VLNCFDFEPEGEKLFHRSKFFTFLLKAIKLTPLTSQEDIWQKLFACHPMSTAGFLQYTGKV